jgi:hypothetical protein
MRHRMLSLASVVVVFCALACGCVPEYEFLKTPRADFKAGSQWKVGIGPITDGPPAGVVVTARAQGLDWLNKQTKDRGGANLTAALAGLFSAGLDIDVSRISLIEVEGLTHQQVVDPGTLTRGYAYLWETVEAAKIKITLDRSLEAELQGKIDKFATSALGQKLNLQFKAAGSSKDTFQVTGRNLVVAIKTVNFQTKARTETVTLRLDRDIQGTDQPGAFGYMISVQPGGVDLPGRKVRVFFRSPYAADSNTGSWEGALSSDSTKVHVGPVIGVKCDGVLDNAYVSAWDTDALTCQVTFQRTIWTLEQVGCGLETLK